MSSLELTVTVPLYRTSIVHQVMQSQPRGHAVAQGHAGSQQGKKVRVSGLYECPALTEVWLQRMFGLRKKPGPDKKQT